MTTAIKNKPPMKTVTQIATTLGVARHRVEFAINTRDIPHAMWVGQTRLFDRDGVERIKSTIEEIDSHTNSKGIQL